MIQSVAAVVILLRLAAGFYEYTPETFPDSIEQPMACGMHEASFLCDPSNVLSNGNITANHILISNALVEVRTSTKCTCSPMDVGRCDDSPRGFTISVAVVRKMMLDVIQSKPDIIRTAAEEFADALRVRQDRGQCDDDVLIFVSSDDHIVWTSLGSVTKRYLMDSAVNAVTTRAESHFNKGDYTEGIRYMVESYTTLLKGESLDLSSDWKWPIPLWLIITIGSGLLILLLIITVIMIYNCVVYCRGDRRAEYTMGTRI